MAGNQTTDASKASRSQLGCAVLLLEGEVQCRALCRERVALTLGGVNFFTDLFDAGRGIGNCLLSRLVALFELARTSCTLHARKLLLKRFEFCGALGLALLGLG